MKIIKRKKSKFMWKTSIEGILFAYDTKLFCVVREISDFANDS